MLQNLSKGWQQPTFWLPEKMFGWGAKWNTVSLFLGKRTSYIIPIALILFKHWHWSRKGNCQQLMHLLLNLVIKISRLLFRISLGKGKLRLENILNSLTKVVRLVLLTALRNPGGQVISFLASRGPKICFYSHTG